MSLLDLAKINMMSIIILKSSRDIIMRLCYKPNLLEEFVVLLLMKAQFKIGNTKLITLLYVLQLVKSRTISLLKVLSDTI